MLFKWGRELGIFLCPGEFQTNRAAWGNLGVFLSVLEAGPAGSPLNPTSSLRGGFGGVECQSLIPTQSCLFSPSGSSFLCLGEFLGKCLRTISFVALYLPGHIPKIWNILGGNHTGHPKIPTPSPGVHLGEAGIPQMRQEEGIELFLMELRGFFGCKNTFHRDGAATLSHCFFLSLLDGVCGKTPGNSMVPFSTVAQGIKSVFLPTTSLSPSEL